MKKILFNLVVIIYVVIAIFVTICLLTFNQYRISEFVTNMGRVREIKKYWYNGMLWSWKYWILP